MTQFSMLPWTTGAAGDGATPYTQEQSNNFFRFFDVRNPAAEGVALGVLNELAVSGAASPLSVATGAAVCYGRYWNDSVTSLNVSTPGVGTTGGRVVLRCSWATRQIRLAVKMSANGIATPPALTQVFGTTWEISLATFTITTGGAITLTDDRSFRKATFQVDTVAIEDLAVATAKIANSAVTTDKIADLNVTTPKIANDSVDDTKVGNRVPQFYRRQGGSSTNWAAAGTTAQMPGAVRMQMGQADFGSINPGVSASVSITFPTAFGDVPLVIATAMRTAGAGTEPVVVFTSSLTTAGFTLYARNAGASLSGAMYVSWLAIGPE